MWKLLRNKELSKTEDKIKKTIKPIRAGGEKYGNNEVQKLKHYDPKFKNTPRNNLKL